MNLGLGAGAEVHGGVGGVEDLGELETNAGGCTSDEEDAAGEIGEVLFCEGRGWGKELAEF